MVVSTAQTVDISQALAGLLVGVPGLRVESYVADKARPPVAVIGLAAIDWQDPDAGFCWATFEVPVTIITTRGNDRDAQAELSRLIRDVANALNTPTPPPGIFSIDPLDARPTIVSISGQDLPAYDMRVRVRA